MKPNRVVPREEFQRVELLAERERLKDAMQHARLLLSASKRFWENDWNGRNIAAAYNVLTKAMNLEQDAIK